MARNNQIKTLIPKKLQQWQPQTPLTGKARLELWEKYRGIWKNKKPDPIKVLQKMRKEWERKLPSLKK
jgi:hypothetical protein